MTQPRSFLLCLCLFLAFTVEGQDNTAIPRRYHRPADYSNDWDFNNRIAFKWTPSSLLDPYGALLPIGLEYYSGNKYGISLDFGFPLYYVLNNGHFDYHKTVNSDFKIRADVRQYFRFRKRSRMFLGAEFFYRDQGMILQNSYFHFIDNACYRFDEAKARKDAFGSGLIWGISQKLSGHLFLQTNIGIGMRVINMSPKWDINNATPYFKGSFVSLELPNEDRIGDHDLNIYIPFAIKISYLF